MRTLSLLCFLLSACGAADVGVSAATAAKLKADQVKQGQQTAARIQQKLEAANQSTTQRMNQETERGSE